MSSEQSGGDVHASGSDDLLGSFSDLTTPERKGQYNNAPIFSLVIVVFLVAALLVVGGVVYVWIRQSRGREHKENRDEEKGHGRCQIVFDIKLVLSTDASI